MSEALENDMSMAARLWQEIVIQAFRIPVRLAFSLGRPSLKDLERLMKAAVIQELTDQGLTQRQMAIALAVSETWVTKLIKDARAIGGLIDTDALLARIVARLERGPADAADLMELTPVGAPYKMDRVALGLLEREGIVVRYGSRPPRYRLSPQFEHLSKEAWARPLARLEQLHLLTTRIVTVLYDTGPATRASLASRLRWAAAADDVRAAIDLLSAEGILVPGGTDPDHLALAEGHLRLIPPDQTVRRRTGLLTMLDAVGHGAVRILKSPQTSPLGQRTVRFRAKIEDVRALIKAHHTETMSRIETLDASAGEEGVDCSMVWMITVGEEG